jgi:hypothetical protein
MLLDCSYNFIIVIVWLCAMIRDATPATTSQCVALEMKVHWIDSAQPLWDDGRILIIC